MRTAFTVAIIGAITLCVTGTDTHLRRLDKSDNDDNHDDNWDISQKGQKLVDTRYNTFWSWINEWQAKAQTQLAEQNITNNKFARQILHRQANLDSLSLKFPDQIENNWNDIIDSTCQKQWGIKSTKRDKKYGSWKQKAQNCIDGYYQDPSTSNNCLKCPVGCKTCLKSDQCLSCTKNFVFVEGYNFGYCYPDCPTGTYIQTLFTNDKSFCNKTNLSRRPELQSLSQMTSQCKKCPDFCNDCVFNEETGMPYCYQSKKGFTFNDQKAVNQIDTACESGQFRKFDLPKNFKYNESTPQIDDYICKDCQKGCLNCTSNQTCTFCKPGFALWAVSSTNKTCVKCPANCKINCILGVKGQALCKQCENNYYPFYGSTTCVMNRTCSIGQWFNDLTLKCQSCPQSCLKCKQGRKEGVVDCLSCTPDSRFNNLTMNCEEICNRQKEYFDRKTGQCTSCGFGFFPDDSNQRCRPCTYKNCQDCIFRQNKNSRRGQEECSVCNISYQFDPVKKICHTNCGQLAVYDYYTQKCTPCQPWQYKNFTDDTCRDCQSDCQSCYMNTKNNQVACTSCKNNLTVDSDTKICRLNCPSDQYFEPKGWQCKKCPSGKVVTDDSRGCGQCPKYCADCSLNIISRRIECSKCNSGSNLDKINKICKPSCPKDQTYNQKLQGCRQCDPYYSYSSKQKKCLPCSKSCLDCVFPLCNNQQAQPKCQKCDNSTILDFKTLQCRPICNSGTVYNNVTQSCDMCSFNSFFENSTCNICNVSQCQECVGDSKSCKQCQSGYVVDNNLQCRQECSTGTVFSTTFEKCISCENGTYFNTTQQQCMRCSSNCNNCVVQNDKLACIECSNGTILDTGICRKPCENPTPLYNSTQQACISCPSSALFNNLTNQCVSCPTNCTSCFLNSTSNKVACSACLNGSIIDTQAQLCKPNCNSNQFYDWQLQKCTQCVSGTYQSSSKGCQSCPANCLSCFEVSQPYSLKCDSCIAGFEIDSVKKVCRQTCNNTQYYNQITNQCASCAIGQYLNTTSMSCQGCPVNCQSCQFNNQSNSAECLTCKTGSIFDTVMSLCKLNCSQSQYYNWDTNSCTTCKSGTFYNPSVQQCQICPENCTTCSFNFITQAVECQGCISNSFVLDSTQKICRDKCNSTAFFNYDSFSCQNCLSSEYINPATQTCSACPSNCGSCFYNSSKQVECLTCSSSFTFERQTCREICNSSALYDWSIGMCTLCPDGKWLDPTSKSCQYCSMGCNMCQPDSLNPLAQECVNCDPTLVIDQGKCRQQCSSNQYFDWNILDCVNCTSPCTQCSDSRTCLACEDIYNLQATDGVCIAKCNSTIEIWNSTTKQCDLLRKFSLTVTAASNRVWRCRNTTISTVGSGFTSSEAPSYTWSYEIVSGGINRNNWIVDINNLVSTANTNKAKTIVITSAFTEKVTDNTTIKFIVTLGLNGQKILNFTNLIVDPYVYTLIKNYSTSYTVWAADGLPLYPAFYYPECPIFKGPAAIPANVSIGCSLYDSKSNLIKTLPFCQIQPTELAQGLSYFIKYYYSPNPLQTGVNGLRDTITVTAYAQLPTCNILNSTLTYVRKVDSLNLQVQIINGKNTFVYQWFCSPLTSGATCGVLQTTQNSPNLSMPASPMTQGASYNFTLKMYENTILQGQCQAKVEVVSPNLLSMPLSLLDSSNSWNYLDPSVTQTIDCYQSTEAQVALNYFWRIQRKSSKIIVYQSGISFSNFTETGSKLIIGSGRLNNDTYDITCQAQNLKYNGTATKTIQTNPILPITVNLDISPSSGVAQDTVFVLTVSKPQGFDIWCNYGQISSDNQDIPLYDDQEIVYSSASQNLMTKLDRIIIQDQQLIFIKCQDQSGSYTRTTKQVIVTSSELSSVSFIQVGDTIGIKSSPMTITELAQKEDQGLSSLTKILISLIPSIVILILFIVPLVLIKAQTWTDVSQIDKTPSKAEEPTTEIDFTTTSQAWTLSSYFSQAKLSIILSRRTQTEFSICDISSRLISALILLSCFSVSLIPSSTILISFLTGYSILLITEISLNLVGKLKYDCAQVALLLMTLLAAFPQPFLIVVGSRNMETHIFIKWISSSMLILMMSAIIQDFIVVPAGLMIIKQIGQRNQS